jgi:hypothetical protein
VSARLTIEELRSTPEWATCTDKQRRLIEVYLETGSRDTAVQRAYGTTLSKHVSSYFRMPAVKRGLAAAFGEEPKQSPIDRLKSDLRKLMLDPQTNSSQIAAVRMLMALEGFSVEKPPTLDAGTFGEQPPEGKVVADQVIEQDGRRLRTVVTDIGAVETV